ncbi:hypothetical protein C8R45DRAFT_904234 [Mycena sanguinolenta]|nr:hypothetical protein C8R45DRAFT_904234 [Mycena sanguinolenta]
MTAQNATVQSLVYGIPLPAYVIFANAIANSFGMWTTNTLNHATALATPNSHAIVLPNVDTLYSAGLLDLSEGDLVATMPSLEEGRFYVWPFYDLYGNNVCNIGTIMNSTAGKYLIKYRASKPGCVAAKDGYAGTIYLPTVYGATLLRIEVNNSSDVDYVVSSIQPNFTLELGPSASYPCAPALTAELLNGDLTIDDPPLYIMQLTARLAANNPPEVIADIAPVTATLETAGISLTTNTYTQPAGVDLSLAYTNAQAVISAVGQNPSDIDSLGNEWSALAPSLSGNFLSHYDVRGFVATGGYLQLQASVAIYPVYGLEQDLYSNQTYMVEFFGKPQVNGFWSLTMYDGDGFLVPNSIDRYSLNDRGNMTYPDGTLVYGGASPSDSTEPFYMLLQTTDIQASAEWESNWLPTPTDGGKFRFNLRWYGPTDSLSDGTYIYPRVTVVLPNPPLPGSG